MILSHEGSIKHIFIVFGKIHEMASNGARSFFATNLDPANIWMFLPNQACLWGSDSLERISVRVVREGGSPVTQDRPQRSCYQDLGTRILIPGS